MVDLKKNLGSLYRDAGLICFILGVGSLIFGIFNLGTLPHFYEAQSGDPSFDGMTTIYVNMVIWILICLFLVFSGEVFYLNRKNIMNLDVKKRGSDTVYFNLIGAGILLGNAVYLILLLVNLVIPVQFLPNVLFAGEESPMDLSPIFNGFLFYLFISLFYRIGGKFIKYGMKIGDLK